MQNKTDLEYNSDEISLSELIQKVKGWFSFLKTQWKKILLVGFISGCIGFVFAWMQPIKYTANISFIVEEGKSNSGGGLAALAGQFGFDVSGGAGNSIIAGDNILLYLKSESLIRATLLSPFDSSKNYSLADKYADVYSLRKSWEKNSKIGKLYFPSNNSKGYSIKQDSLLKGIISNILLKQLSVERPEKKATFIVAQVTFNDQILAKLFCERLVYLTTEKYVDIKTTRQKNNVNKLQYRADSLEHLLNLKTYTSTESLKKLMDLNPLFRSEATSVEISGRDKMVIQTIYGEIVKNLEIARVTLNQETPVIQVVDSPYLPLKKNKTSKLISLIVGGFFGSLIFIGWLIIRQSKQGIRKV